MSNTKELPLNKRGSVGPILALRDMIVEIVIREVLRILFEGGYISMQRTHLSEDEFFIVQRIERSDRLAYRQQEAAELLGISRSTICREIAHGKIVPTKTLRLITREELLRYLREEVRLARHKRRVPRSEYKPVPLNPEQHQ